MSLYKFAPKAVIDNLSQNALSILEMRLQDGYLKPYVPIVQNIRIRGLKPSILYVCFTLLNSKNIAESMYAWDSEETQCQMVAVKIKNILAGNSSDLLMRSMTEMTWCSWEDKYMYETPALPLEHLHSGYKDIMNNSFVHCIAYACANRTPTSIEEAEAQFQALDFINNTNIYSTNDLGETPLKILTHNEKLSDFVESLLLRLPPERRLEALPLSSWNRYWGSLMNTVVNEHMPLLISQTKYDDGFLNTFMHLTFGNQEALETLFENRYILELNHIYRDTIKREQTRQIGSAILQHPSWQNLTLWLYLMINSNDIYYFSNMRNYLCCRIGFIREELVAKVFKPHSRDKIDLLYYL
jgi:hypothetical protein